MPVCQITGKKVIFGRNVSHSQRKTSRQFKANNHSYRFKHNGRTIRLCLSSKGLRYIRKHGLDQALEKIALLNKKEA